MISPYSHYLDFLFDVTLQLSPISLMQVQKAVTTVTVTEPVTEIEVICLGTFPTWEEKTCIGTVYRGTDIEFRYNIPAQFGEAAKSVAFFKIAGMCATVFCAIISPNQTTV